jgi:hypothetical protein
MSDALHDRILAKIPVRSTRNIFKRARRSIALSVFIKSFRDRVSEMQKRKFRNTIRFEFIRNLFDGRGCEKLAAAKRPGISMMSASACAVRRCVFAFFEETKPLSSRKSGFLLRLFRKNQLGALIVSGFNSFCFTNSTSEKYFNRTRCSLCRFVLLFKRDNLSVSHRRG